MYLYSLLVSYNHILLNTMLCNHRYVQFLKRITKEIACLVIVDGGARTEQAVVIGTY